MVVDSDLGTFASIGNGNGSSDTGVTTRDQRLEALKTSPAFVALLSTVRRALEVLLKYREVWWGKGELIATESILRIDKLDIRIPFYSIVSICSQQ